MSSLRERERENVREKTTCLVAGISQKKHTLVCYILVSAFSWSHCCPLLKAVHDQIQRYLTASLLDCAA